MLQVPHDLPLCDAQHYAKIRVYLPPRLRTSCLQSASLLPTRPTLPPALHEARLRRLRMPRFSAASKYDKIIHEPLQTITPTVSFTCQLTTWSTAVCMGHNKINTNLIYTHKNKYCIAIVVPHALILNIGAPRTSNVRSSVFHPQSNVKSVGCLII